MRHLWRELAKRLARRREAHLVARRLRTYVERPAA
jgi:hypothetical protein